MAYIAVEFSDPGVMSLNKFPGINDKSMQDSACCSVSLRVYFLY